MGWNGDFIRIAKVNGIYIPVDMTCWDYMGFGSRDAIKANCKLIQSNMGEGECMEVYLLTEEGYEKACWDRDMHLSPDKYVKEEIERVDFSLPGRWFAVFGC